MRLDLQLHHLFVMAVSFKVQDISKQVQCENSEGIIETRFPVEGLATVHTQ